ncbi:MAG: type II toxin-antitoxin system RelE/ParE family toxin [Syntrophorhabdaceae bacterium]|nr:type II toxin-antitoxin system RelE/ParE family toxin [Syntrophorhabdaceae bacterium]
MRAFKNRWFHRWARKENLPDALLLRVAKEILDGKVEADLGGGLFKKRLARSGGGKRGGYRTIVGYKKPNSERIIFLYAFAKNRKANMTAEEEAALSIAAESFILASDAQVAALLEEGAILEVQT